ncbi:TetR family transcriptional regulator [Aeromicrobium sp. PE09-221]|uniref:TetR/AcrR family transcriptional regulator n=1 Tax=Aeromicrobium sp. PE09-221 TaxID=1898043 RepID=UPI000B3E6195|nr:TetR family transcriptional regulator [Aeromicrobium sp. PE09-221]
MTAAARIRDTAIELFGREGFGVGLRAIAEEAGVSLGLIRHHFGSKEGLRRACDDHAMGHLQELQAEQVGAGEKTATLLDQLAAIEDYRPFVRYFLQVLRSGDGPASLLIDRLTASTLEYLEAGVAKGMFKPSIDPPARARFLVLMKLGAMVLQHALAGDADDAYDRYIDVAALPGLELYTQGLLTDDTLLDGYLRQREGSSEETAARHERDPS